MHKIVLIFLSTLSLSYSVDIYETIFDGNCGSCHTKKDESSAPTIIKVIKRYKKMHPIKNDFVKSLSNWVSNPNKKESLFKNAIKHYGLMPELGIDKETLQGIAKYLYQSKN